MISEKTTGDNFLNTITPEYKIIESLPSLYSTSAQVIAASTEMLQRGVARYLLRFNAFAYDIKVSEPFKRDDGKLQINIVRSSTCD